MKENVDNPHVTTVIAPSGALGLTLLDRDDGNGPYVFKIRPDSNVAGKVFPGDRIIAIDSKDVSNMKGSEVANLLIAMSSDIERHLTILRGTDEADITEMEEISLTTIQEETDKDVDDKFTRPDTDLESAPIPQVPPIGNKHGQEYLLKKWPRKRVCDGIFLVVLLILLLAGTTVGIYYVITKEDNDREVNSGD